MSTITKNNRSISLDYFNSHYDRKWLKGKFHRLLKVLDSAKEHFEDYGDLQYEIGKKYIYHIDTNLIETNGYKEWRIQLHTVYTFDHSKVTEPKYLEDFINTLNNLSNLTTLSIKTEGNEIENVILISTFRIPYID